MKLATNYFEWQRRLVLPELGRRVLEVGCGIGNFTQSLTDREMVIGTDSEAECIRAHTARFRSLGHIASLQQDVLDPSFLGLRRKEPDSVVCLNVLEHIDDHLTALRHIHSVLPPGGRAVVIVPAFLSLYGLIDANLGHRRRYTKRSLRFVAGEAGFVIQALRYFNSLGFFGWWLNARILRKTEQSPAQIAFFDAKIVPVLSFVESRIELPWGQSLLAVLVKPQ